MNKYYVLATHQFNGKVVAFPAKDTIEECEQDIERYDKMDNKNGINYKYSIVVPLKGYKEITPQK